MIIVWDFKEMSEDMNKDRKIINILSYLLYLYWYRSFPKIRAQIGDLGGKKM